MGTSLLILRYITAPATAADAFSLWISTFAHDRVVLTRETLPSSALTGYWTWWAVPGHQELPGIPGHTYICTQVVVYVQTICMVEVYG